MLRRVARSTYHMTCLIERAENTARLVEAYLDLLLDTSPDATLLWRSLIAATSPIAGSSGLSESSDGEKSDSEKIDTDTALAYLLFDSDNPRSVFSCVQTAREQAQCVHESLPSDYWEQLNLFYLRLQAVERPVPLSQIEDVLSDAKCSAYLLAGSLDATLLRQESWHFAQMGRLLERATKTVAVLSAMPRTQPWLDQTKDIFTGLEDATLLKALGAYGAYRREHGQICPERMLDFLILSPTAPRSLLFCLTQIGYCLQMLSRTAPQEPTASVQTLDLLLADLTVHGPKEMTQLHQSEFWGSVPHRLRAIETAIFSDYFSHE